MQLISKTHNKAWMDTVNAFRNLLGADMSTVIVKKIDNNSEYANSLFDTSIKNQGVTSIIHLLFQLGYTLSTTLEDVLIEEIQIPLGKKFSFRISLDMIRYHVKTSTLTVGQLVHIISSDKDLLVSLVRQSDGTFSAYYVQNGRIEHMILDKDGNAVATTAPLTNLSDTLTSEEITCESVCQSLCNAGLTGAIPSCVAGCLETGPGEAICSPLCIALVSLGCLFGCADICRYLQLI